MPENRSQSFFDRFAERASAFCSEAPFFAFCVLMVVVWLPTFPLVGTFDTWQLLINTPTTIVTFLLVALLQNTQRRNEIAVQAKLDALAHGLADLMEHFINEDTQDARGDLENDVRALKEAIGLEERVSA